MKRMRTALGLAVAALALFAAGTFAGCSSDGGESDSVKLQEIPGTIGKASDELLAGAELLKEIDSDNEKTILFYYRPDGEYSDWGLWLWEDNGNGVDAVYDATAGKFESKTIVYNEKSFNIGYMTLEPSMFEEKAPNVASVIKEKKNLNFIIRTAAWGKDIADDQSFDLSGGTHFMVVSGDKDVYPLNSEMTPFISSATMETLTTMKVTLSVKYALEDKESENGFLLIAEDSTNAHIKDVVNYNAKSNRGENFANTLYVTLASPLDMTKTWKIKHEDFYPAEGCKIGTSTAIKISLNDYKYEGNDLGLSINGDKASFKVWAPIASKVKILFYDDVSKVGNFKPETVALNVSGSTTEGSLKGEPVDSQEMNLDKDSGIWSYELESIGSKKYYKYQITNNGVDYYVADIYAKSCSPDSIASQIVDINADTAAIPGSTSYGTKENYKNPFGTNGNDSKDYTDAVIYEMHIRDWSRALNPSSTGKFNEICSDEIINHLKDLGITHVQILPMFDYAQVNSDTGYNWGYNPYHYNVPEGRYTDYSSNPDGTAAVEQMRAMIKKFHENGIAVIMDVVYNHTSGIGGGSLYDSTVPYYYYRLNSDGSYSNGSGCGNETDSEAPMFRKYMIDTLKHWMLDYHINGFRFDLMGLHGKEAMAEIYKELSSIDKNVMIYGEPWTGGNSQVKNSTTSAVMSESYGVGAFDDDFRDAIKGAEFGGFNAGQVQGNFADDGIAAGLTGKSGKNSRNTTGIPGLALHYAECHDNFTLYDKLVYSLDLQKTQAADKDGKIATAWPASVSDEQLELIRKQDKLAAAYVLLSQGTPFINGGQEFLRTKKGNPDSYAADTKGGKSWENIDEVNTVDLGFKEKYSDVYNTYKGLIALRKSSAAFTDGSDSTAEKLVAGVTLYRAKSGPEEFDIYFNASDAEFTIPGAQADGLLGLGVSSAETSFGAKGKRVEIDEKTGVVRTADAETTVSSVPAKSFVILKK